MEFQYGNIAKNEICGTINTVFPDFGQQEVLAVMSPHDDDAIIGAGYAILAAQQAGAQVYIVIFCRGDAGYSTVAEKETIEQTRKGETDDCYRRLGIPADHILRLNFPDFSAFGNIGWEKADGKPGQMPILLRFLREKRVTRVMVPNHYHEHIDHLAAHLMSSYDVPQAGDAALVDHGTPHPVRSVLEYSVWADLDPEDALVCGRNSTLRANRVIVADTAAEDRIRNAIAAYVSQAEIIRGLVNAREERRTAGNTYVEVYLTMDCRPKINFRPYIDWVEAQSH